MLEICTKSKPYIKVHLQSDHVTMLNRTLEPTVSELNVYHVRHAMLRSSFEPFYFYRT